MTHHSPLTTHDSPLTTHDNMSVAIKIENLSKQYRLGLVSTRTLSHDLNRWYQINIRGKEDPYLKIGEINDRSTKGESEYVWALKDFNLDIDEGEVLGIIGKNGAGKSTLLKILSKITAPTAGIIKARGRIASLLEVGTGFHQEMTGRENIYLNGAILGMTKPEINKKLEEIIDFAGVERYIDTPVKRYSSGMLVRLGFAVAAHLEPEILVVDEVLAVGDAEFQKKAMGKMQNVSQYDGRTILFVSHNMTAINSICKKAIVLDSGSIAYIGKTESMIQIYLKNSINDKRSYVLDNCNIFGDEYCVLQSTKLVIKNKKQSDYITLEDEVGVEIIFTILKFTEGVANINLYSGDGSHIFFSSENQRKNYYQPGVYKSIMWIPPYLLNNKIYNVSVYFTSLIPYKIHFEKKDALCFEVLEDVKNRNIEYYGELSGAIRPNLKWEAFKL